MPRGEVAIVGRSTCPWCQAAIQLATTKYDKMMFIDINNPHLSSEQKRFISHARDAHYPRTTVPIVFIGTRYIGGYDDFAQAK